MHVNESYIGNRREEKNKNEYKVLTTYDLGE